jgi:hypothetical protein
MAQIPFTDRELRRAWKALRSASSQLPRTNAHRLLLVYSVECGLKAMWLKNECRTLFVAADIARTGHDLNEVIKQLRIGVELPTSFDLSDAKDEQKNTVTRRRCRLDTLHQAWRYGGELANPPMDDAGMEEKLEAVQRLIEKELMS